MKTNPWLTNLQRSLRPLRTQLIDHDVYRRVKTASDLRIFMEHHVFAVWDFMSLLKALQRDLTCVSLPWAPAGHRLSRRLINEIVLEEESDVDGAGGYTSHFELYRNAMKQCGADTAPIDVFVDAVRGGGALEGSLAQARAPLAAREFVKTTMTVVDSRATHAIAAAFTLGREDVIPVMFQSLIAGLNDDFPGGLTLFQNYLDRHIKLDEERHGPMALEMLAELCGRDPRKWQEAEHIVRIALQARIALWNGVTQQMISAHREAPVRGSIPLQGRKSTECFIG